MAEPASLRSIFDRACALRSDLSSSASLSNISASNDTLETALSLFRECQRLADANAIFSPNETADDVATGDLPYLNIDYYLGDLLLRSSPHVDRAEEVVRRRTQILDEAQGAFEHFLRRLEGYEMLRPADLKLLERWSESSGQFALATSNDPARKREAKIAAFKQEKELDRNLELRRQDSRAQHDDDEALRALYRAELDMHVHRSWQALEGIAQERAVLALAPPPGSQTSNSLSTAASDPRSRPSDASASSTNNSSRAGEYSERLDPPISQLQNLPGGRGMGPILNTDGRPLQPFTLLDARAQVRDGVFRPGHNLPTMTIDEYLDEERRRGGIIEGGGGDQPRPAVDEDDHDAADRETVKAREWDEFKEDNPKGSGNTLNRG